MIDSDDDKYITFKRSEFSEWLATGVGIVESPELRDAVVIRRQDLFASPCLATYANMIALVARHLPDKDQSDDLLAIADYFERQAILAADEGHKLPDR